MLKKNIISLTFQHNQLHTKKSKQTGMKLKLQLIKKSAFKNLRTSKNLAEHL